MLQIGPSERNGHHPAVFFRSTAFGKLISFSGEPADLVLIDTPALLGVSEAVTIADHADAILLVVNRGTSLADLRRARDRLGFTDTPLIGYLLNRAVAHGVPTPAASLPPPRSARLRQRGATAPPRAPQPLARGWISSPTSTCSGLRSAAHRWKHLASAGSETPSANGRRSG